MISTMVANLVLLIKTTRPTSTYLQLAVLTKVDIVLVAKGGWKGKYARGREKKILMVRQQAHSSVNPACGSVLTLYLVAHCARNPSLESVFTVGVRVFNQENFTFHHDTSHMIDFLANFLSFLSHAHVIYRA